jgi:hypothetical protein
MYACALHHRVLCIYVCMHACMHRFPLSDPKLKWFGTNCAIVYYVVYIHDFDVGFLAQKGTKRAKHWREKDQIYFSSYFNKNRYTFTFFFWSICCGYVYEYILIYTWTWIAFWWSIVYMYMYMYMYVYTHESHFGEIFGVTNSINQIAHQKASFSNGPYIYILIHTYTYKHMHVYIHTNTHANIGNKRSNATSYNS